MTDQMNIAASSAKPLSTPDSDPLFYGFRALESLQETSEAAGWDIEYRQIESGCLEARALIQQVGDIALIRESANKQMEVRASTPNDSITILAGVFVR